jgi:uncharacterized lipoprotein YbaY
MKVTYKLLVPALLAGFLLAACAEKEAEAPVEEMTTEEAAPAEEMATEEAPAEEASDEPGGYVPTDDERIPGETR